MLSIRALDKTDFKPKNGCDFVQRFDRRITFARLDLPKAFHAQAAMHGELGLGQLAQAPYCTGGPTDVIVPSATCA